MYVAPVGGTTTGVLTWSVAPPPPTFFTSTFNDLYTNPWW